MNSLNTPEPELEKILRDDADRQALQRHVKEIIKGTGFKGSHRSGEFLRYIVDQAVAGHFESLKERVIGVELFGRSPSYDTSTDAIVRVTASEVRKRLLQHYGTYGETSPFHLGLPVGSYIPEITRVAQVEAPLARRAFGAHDGVLAPGSGNPVNGINAASSPEASAEHLAATQPETLLRKSGLTDRRAAFALLILALNLALWGVFSYQSSHKKEASVAVLPWPAFFRSANSTLLVTSDPNIAEIQALTDTSISVSDYANHKYVPEPNTLTPEVDRICRNVLEGDKSAAVDTPIAVNIAQLAQANSRQINVRSARSIQISDLHTGDNLILLGSPRSNPWTALFSDQLDFRFGSGKVSAQDAIVNVHPHPGELPTYFPAAKGYATGDSFAILALVQNPNPGGLVLLIAGESAEGTTAAGQLAVDLPRLSSAIQKCGIQPSGIARPFELLIRVNSMAGSPNSFDVVACHLLSGAPAQQP